MELAKAAVPTELLLGKLALVRPMPSRQTTTKSGSWTSSPETWKDHADLPGASRAHAASLPAVTLHVNMEASISRLFREALGFVVIFFLLIASSARAEPPVEGKPSTRQLSLPVVNGKSGPPEPIASHRFETSAPAPKQGKDFLTSICLEIQSAAATHNLPASFLIRLIWQESRFDPRAVSRAGAQGIAQFMPETARWRGLTNPFDPHWSVHESARWLGELRSQFGNLGLAAAAYNAGPARVKEWLDGKRGLPPETQAYVRIVTQRSAEEWALLRVQDASSVLSAPIDCRILDPIRMAILTTSRRALSGRESKRPPGKQLSVSKRLAWTLQLIGDRSEERALAAYRNLQNKFPTILGERPPVLIKRQLGGRGFARWYQVRVAETSREAANAICSRLRSAGGQCLVLSD
jgi:hypothetical protein